MNSIQLPFIDEHIETALREARDYVLNRFDSVLAIIVAGSILRGEGDAHSDIDTFVIIEGDYRQRIQKYFNDIPFEIFVNAIEFIPLYFEEERKDGGASTAHMLATGHLIYQQSKVIDGIIQQAKDFLKTTPVYDSKSLIQTRYLLANRLENAFDVQHRDPIMGLLLIDSALSEMLLYQFKKEGQWIPRHKDILNVLRNTHPDLVKLVTDYYQADFDERFRLAGLIADYTLGTRGFFEWESDKDFLD